MNIGKIFPILGFAAVLVLTGCSSPETTDMPTSTVKTSAVPVMPQAGDTVEAPGVTLTVDSVSDSDHLMLHAKGVKAGTKPQERLDPPTGGRFVTVTTTVQNTGFAPWDLTCSFALQGHVFNDDGQRFDDVGELYRLSGNPGCSDKVNPGFNSAMNWSFAVPEDSKITRFGFADPETNYNDLTMIDISDAKPSDASEASSTIPPSEEVATPQIPVELGAGKTPGGKAIESGASEPKSPAVSATQEPTQSAGSIWNEPGDGYNCAATDAWVDDPALCTSANLGGDPSYDSLWGPEAALPGTVTTQDPATVPFADGGTCPGAICGYGHNQYGQRNPTSGEIQTLHGCQDGYITDPELCRAVAWVDGWQY